jgi:hypothetical protein
MPDGTFPATADAQLEQWLQRIDSALHQAFRTARQRTDDGFTGRDFHVVTLHASRDFWDWADLELIDDTWADMELALDALAAALTFRWGTPDDVELWPYLQSLAAGEAGEAPEPISLLSMSTSEMRVWRPPGHDRYVALALGQQDKELPIELLAAVGTAASLTRPRTRPESA